MTPVGKVEFDRVTLPVNPPVSVTVMVSVAVLPCVTDSVVGDADSLNPAGVPAVMVRAMVVDATGKAPEVPVIVTVALPCGADELAVNVSTLVPVVGLVPNEAVTPLGNPETASVTLPVKPPASATVIVSAPLAPWAIDRVNAEGEIEKLGTAVVPSGN